MTDAVFKNYRNKINILIRCQLVLVNISSYSVGRYMNMMDTHVTMVLKSEHVLSQSHTEHTAYTVGHPCKSYIQPNQPWPYPSYNRAIREYP
ncbi:hypothetical protein KUTeg_000680 [Tegillarca granosa]|uniref:Uncharacterized protein n=1 Tax=Tegillarca granosa TaxID=220873 RepID=A0ABQ9FY88_TEGGR|nr:hypothetical protein KUTeg_000680 [Tegillarca granosa]